LDRRLLEDKWIAKMVLYRNKKMKNWNTEKNILKTQIHNISIILPAFVQTYFFWIYFSQCTHTHTNAGRDKRTHSKAYTCSHSGGAYEKFSIWMQTCWIIMIFFLPLAVFLVSLLAGFFSFFCPNVVDPGLQLLGIFCVRRVKCLCYESFFTVLCDKY